VSIKKVSHIFWNFIFMLHVNQAMRLYFLTVRLSELKQRQKNTKSSKPFKIKLQVTFLEIFTFSLQKDEI